MADKDILRLAAMADLHSGKVPPQPFGPLFAQAAEEADVLVLCGDLTDHGQPEEATALVEVLSSVRIPILMVLGNHDFHAGKASEIRRIFAASGAKVLDGDAVELFGVGFAGVKGFLGGFGQRTLEPWGEEIVKQIVHEAVNESLKLESALAQLRTPQRIALLHYAPIQETVEGEPPEIYAFLGCSRLEEPLQRYGVSAVFHGHAHRGQPEGRMRNDVPVYNVALPLLQRLEPNRPPFRLVEIPILRDEPSSAAHVTVHKPIPA